MNKIKAAWVIGAIGRGGVITVCRNATEFVALNEDFDVSLVAINTCMPGFVVPTGVKVEILNLPFQAISATTGFIKWLENNPQDILFFNDASYAEPSWPFIPPTTVLVPVLHDVARGWRKNIVKYHKSWDMVVTVSEFVKGELLKDIPHCAGRIRVVHNGIKFSENHSRNDAGIKERLQLVYAGSTDPFKGIFDIPHIISLLERENVIYDLYILSVPDETIKNMILNRIRKGKLIWEGYLNHDECMARFANSDILVMPSRSEPFGMVTVEAMTMGCVPVAYDLPSGSREIIKNGQTGLLVSPSSPTNIAKAIVELYHNRTMLKEIGYNAMKDVRERFSAEKMADGYIRVAREAMDIHLKNTPLRKDFDVKEIEIPTRSLWFRLLPSVMKKRVKKVLCKNVVFSAWLRKMRG